MNREWFIRMIKVATIALTVAAICQELEKPKEQRKWHGKLAGLIPYDFRLPTIERIKSSYWNPDDSRLFSPEVFGLGWAINLHAVLERLNLSVGRFLSEEDFLMPSQHIKELLTHPPERE